MQAARLLRRFASGALLPAFMLAAVGVGLRAAWIADVQPAPPPDATWYVARAKNFAAGHGMSLSDRPTAYRPVGYPVLLGSAYRAFGTSDALHRQLNLLISALTLLCLYLTALRLTRSRLAAISGTLLFALY